MRSWLEQVRHIFRRIRHLAPYCGVGPRLIAAVLAGMFVMTLFEGVGVGLLIPLLSLLLGGESATPMRPLQWVQQAFPDGSSVTYVAILAGAIIASIVVKNVATVATSVVVGRMKQRVTIKLRAALFDRLLAADLHVYETCGAGELANLFSNEVVRATNAFETFVVLIQRLGMAALYTMVLLYVSIPLTLTAVALSVLVGASIAFLYKWLSKLGREVVIWNQKLHSRLSEAFTGVRVVRAVNAQSRERDLFEQTNLRQAEVEERTALAHAVMLPSVETLAVVGAMAIIIFAYTAFVRPGLMLSSHLLGFGFILIRILPLLNQIYGLQGHLVYSGGGLAEIEKWLTVAQYPEPPFGRKSIAAIDNAIEVDSLRYSYPNGRVAVDGVTFSIPAGKTVALVGRSGSGKSTIASLLLRLRRPTGGGIKVDGVDYWEYTPESWHGIVSLVEQEAFLFHDTLAANVGYGFADADRGSILGAIRASYLEDVVAELPEGLETIIGERGVMLSGGQRQRLAIARALVRNPKVLILDEATSHLDNISEHLVQSALKAATEGRTTLIIAHRLSTIRHADHIVVIDNGHVVEQGTWHELESRNGAFEQLLQGIVLDQPAAVANPR